MKKNEKVLINLSYDLLNIFTDYCFSLDSYFKDENNRINHLDLYNEYMTLDINIKNCLKKNGLDKK